MHVMCSSVHASQAMSFSNKTSGEYKVHTESLKKGSLQISLPLQFEEQFGKGVPMVVMVSCSCLCCKRLSRRYFWGCGYIANVLVVSEL
jgi:hypothetical protein